MKMNRRLLLFEHKKSILNKTYLILFISLFVSMTLFVSYNYIQNQSYISEMKEQYKIWEKKKALKSFDFNTSLGWAILLKNKQLIGESNPCFRRERAAS